MFGENGEGREGRQFTNTYGTKKRKRHSVEKTIFSFCVFVSSLFSQIYSIALFEDILSHI